MAASCHAGHVKTHREARTEGERPGEGEGRHWSEEAFESRTSPGVDVDQRLRRGKEAPFLEPTEGTGPAESLISHSGPPEP